MANQIDSYTITPEEQLAMAGQIREEKRGKDKEVERGDETKSEKRSLRESVIAARQAMDIKAKAKKKIEEKVMMPVRQGTNWLLRWAWATLIPSFGLTLIYINMHIFLRQVFPSAFCKLGEEWMPKMVGAGEHSAKNVAGTAFGIVEVMGLLLLDLIALFLILLILGLVVMIITWLGKDFWGKLWSVFKGIWDLGWGGVIDLVKLFS